MNFHLLSLSAGTLFMFAACTSQPKLSTYEPLTSPPVTRENIGPIFADYAVEVADTSHDGVITKSEWLAAGGTVESFTAIDMDNDKVITLSELKTASSTDRFFEFAKQHIDTGGNTSLTPQALRSPAGAKLFSFQF